jgi:hypothetical protein
MFQAACPQLRGIAMLQRGKYDLRYALIARNVPEDELRQADAEVVRVNRMIAKHRRRCPQCMSVFTTMVPEPFNIQSSDAYDD